MMDTAASANCTALLYKTCFTYPSLHPAKYVYTIDIDIDIIDIFMNSHINIEIGIFQIALIDIDIDIFKISLSIFSQCSYRYFLVLDILKKKLQVLPPLQVLNNLSKFITIFLWKFLSPYSTTILVINLVFTKFGNKFITKLCVRPFCHHISWQICHKVLWIPNMSPCNSPKSVTNFNFLPYLVTYLSPNLSLREGVNKTSTSPQAKRHQHHSFSLLWLL